jgi:8-amino-7-oxononanoate synthase
VSLDEHLRAELSRLDQAGILRRRAAGLPPAPELLDICTNDYLGYARRSVSRETVATLGAGASRLIYGSRSAHLALEAELAHWVGHETALLFPSGYSANLAAVSSLPQPGDLIVSDALNHASIIDGCRLSRAQIEVVPHRDLDAFRRALQLPARRRWVVSESYFSMDGDSPDLPALRALCDAHDAWLILDEAHALGVFGPSGAGLARQAGVVPDVLVGTLGKAVGAQGAFIAGSAELGDYLWTRARSFVFTTAPSPALCELTLAAVRRLIADDEARQRLKEHVTRLETALRDLSDRLPRDRHGPIFPVFFGEPDRAVAAAAALRDRGFLSQPIRPPTVPHGTSRVRVALHSVLTPDQVDQLAAALIAVCAEG